MEQEKHICCYCGQEAHFQFKNGKWCCHESMNLCPQIKKTRSEASKKLWSIRKENGTNSASSELKDFGLKRKHNSHTEIIEYDGVHCQYGCGKEAKYVLHNGVHCCSDLANRCEAIRRKNSEGLKKAYAEHRIDHHIIYANLSEESKERMKWNKGLTAETSESIRKGINTTKSRYMSGEIVPHFLGKHHTEETKNKIRNTTLDYVMNTLGARPRYNKKSIPILEAIGKEHGWNLQHAENGGEFYTGIHAFVDAYDKEKNIVVEYDETVHYVDIEKNILREKDIKRQQRIIDHLHCDFYRYNEATGVLWKVDYIPPYV